MPLLARARIGWNMGKSQSVPTFTPRLGDRQFRPGGKKKAVIGMIAAWLILVVVGAVLGYEGGSRSDHWITCILGGVAGWIVMILSLWVVVAFLAIKEDPKARPTD